MQFKPAVENIDVFMESIEQYPRLTHEQERELANKIHHGTPEEAKVARDWLICCNLRLAVTIAHTYKRYHNSLSELIQEASKGLVVAADKFDPDRCSKFSMPAALWCKQYIRRFLAQSTRTIKLPTASAQLAAKVAKTRNALLAKTGIEPTDEELSSTLGISLQRLQGARTADIGICSVDDRVSYDSETTFLDMLETEDDTEATTAEETVARIEKMLAEVDTLTDIDRFLLQHTYGISCKAVSADILATETGWDKRRIHGRICSLFRKLRAQLATD